MMKITVQNFKFNPLYTGTIDIGKMHNFGPDKYTIALNSKNGLGARCAQLMLWDGM
mgnify:CR=1 FL=1